ncbi:hypothetical protein KVR01_001129 [Diaporthe batatas]|uniref:uncharacterized protein n=1 Tax=Diaporthe batatas TaxID=748121 RepID=UPI001D03E3A0|nr:uncharacterized protein KVR01_001129 [Diaporthe batatas]KAG8168380.1 hypothetical protein KVR01_001129 [Diaporthe batatas]
MYQSPIPETSNVRYVENRILIDAPHTVVFDYVTTWANLPKWLPVAKNVYVRKGDLNAPARLGDVLCEGVRHEEGFSATATRADKIYTVVLHVPGLLWGVAGVDDVGDPWVGKTATFITTPVFQQIRKEGDDSEVRHPVLQPEVMQKGLERLKDLVENSIGSSCSLG